MNSYSSLETLTRCARKYYYRYIQNLEKKGDWSPAPYLGTAFHTMMEWHNKEASVYDLFNDKTNAIHESDLYEDEKIEQIQLWEQADDLYARYLDKYGDEEYKVISAEEEYYWGDMVSCTPDLVLKNGLGVVIRDYKTTQTIPLELDFGGVQSLTYLLAVSDSLANEKVVGFEYDFIRSKTPTEPRLKKDGSGVAYLNTIDTTFEMLRDFLTLPKHQHLLDEPDHRRRLVELKNDEERWFKRFMVWNTPELLEAVTDEIRTRLAVLQGNQLAQAWPRSFMSKGVSNCNSCSYNDLCQAEWFGFNTKLVLRGYQERASRHDEEEQE